MENERKENKRQFVEDKGQKFYFNEDGKLIVESNKGVWTDGEQFVKMYGSFTCNAKTLGVIIKQFKGIQVEVDTRPEEQKLNEFMEFLQKEYQDECESHRKELERLKIRNENINVQIKNYRETIENFNRLPWWKRMLKKIEVK